jgi:flagellar M-ring protein FliF
VETLKAKKIPFQGSADGTAVSVPRESVPEIRLLLATEGLPVGGSVGMEVFDQNSIGTTDFVQRLNYQRALQGELERTILKFKEVDQVRVHLNVPKQSLFIEEEREPSASVVLKMRGGRTLDRSQLEGIVHLVSSSVEGLKAENVSVVDTAGGLLYSKEDESGGALVSKSQIQYRRSLETNLADRITSMLERVVGPGKAMARVTADLNFQQVSQHEEIYDPDRSVLRSEQRFSETTTGPAQGASGVPNARYDLGTDVQGQDEEQEPTQTYTKTEETTNYEITKINRQVLTPGGEVARLSVAVIVDGSYREEEQDGETVKTYVPRSQEELASLEQLVRNAVGYNEQRGDSVVVSSVPFYLSDESFKASLTDSLFDYLDRFGRPALNILLIVLFFLFVVRPLISWVQKEMKPVEEVPVQREALPEAEAAPALPDTSKIEPGRVTREQVMALAQQEPEKAVNLIRNWIDQR